jgi:hypothetical protein
MIKLIFISGLAAITFASQKSCSNKNLKTGCYKGRLEIKAICSNYTIKLLEGNIDTGKVATSWTDENTSKIYTNVFALNNPCSFPDSLQQGDEFYFTVKEEKETGCMVCKAYYPVPPKRLSISVIKNCP